MKKMYFYKSALNLLLLIFTDINCEKIWSSIYECENTMNKDVCTKTLTPLSKLIIIHNKLKLGPIYYHFLWLARTEPSIVVAHTVNNCSLSIDYSKYSSNSLEQSISFIFDGGICKPINGYSILSFVSVQEVMEAEKIIKEYKFTDFIKNITVEKSIINDPSMKFIYDSGRIVVAFQEYSYRHKQKTIPFLEFSPFNNHITVKIINLTTNSCDSNFILNFNIYSSQNKTFDSDINRFYSDFNTPSVFESYEISSLDKTEKENFTLSYYWKNIALTDASKQKSSKIFSKLNNFTKCSINHTFDTLNYFGINATDAIGGYCGQVYYETLNKENCYHSKKLLIWESIFGFERPHYESIPLVVLLIIVLGYTIPLAFVLGACILVLVRYNSKFKRLLLSPSSSEAYING